MENRGDGKTDENALCFFFGETVKSKLIETMSGIDLSWPEGTQIGSDMAARKEEISQYQKALESLEQRKSELESGRYEITVELRGIGALAGA
jgi:hypothetical protein